VTPLAPGLAPVALDRLREAEENPRTIDDEAFADLKYALAHDPTMLDARPVIVDAEDYDEQGRHAIVCGNMRHRASLELLAEGDERFATVPTFVKVFDSQAQRREWMLRDNQEFGEYVPDELARLVVEHRDADGDVRALGFRETEVGMLIARATEPEFVPATPEEQGDLDSIRELECPECGHTGNPDTFRK
jgi:hypothetical protein